MNELPNIKEVFDKLRQGAYITDEQGILHASLADKYEDYKTYFEPLGLNLVRHPRDFFYFHTDSAENTPPSSALPAVAVFCFILIESSANEGRPVEEYLLTDRFSVAGLPHLTLDRYKAHLKAVGIGDASPFARYVVCEELLAAGAQVSAHWFADRQSGPQILRYGTEAQRARHLPAICRGEQFFCIGMSEPNSGSDLASIKARARREGDKWVVNGQKVWTTNAHRSHYMIALLRTGRE